MNFLFDTSIDVSRRQFYVLAMGSCIGNLAGFIGNALIFGWSGTTIFCGLCMLLMVAGSFHWNKKRTDTLCVLFDDSSLKSCGISGTVLYISDGNDCIHGTCDGSNCDFYSNRKCNPVCRRGNCSRCGSSYFSLYETAGK